MSTTPSVITAPSAPPTGSNFDQIHAYLSEPEPSQAGTESTASESAAQAEPEVQTQPEVTESGEQAEKTAEATAAEPEITQEANPYEEPEESDFKPQTLQEILRTPDGRKMLANHKALREITKAIGHVPTVEQATQYYGAYREVTLLNEYVNSGNPERASDAIAYLFDPQTRGEGAQVVAAQIGPTLLKSNPDAYEVAAQPFVTTYGERLWQRFLDEPKAPNVQQKDGTWKSGWEGSIKQAYYNAAQAINKDFTGKYRDIPGETGATQSPAADPLAEQRAQLATREQHLSQIEQQNRQQAERQWYAALDSKIGESLYSELDKALAKVKETYGTAPKIYNALRKEFHDVVKAGAMQNRAAWDIFQVNLARAKRSGSPEAIDAVAKEYIRLATPVIISNRKKFIEEAGVSAVQASDAKHAELRSIDSHRAPSNGGSPVQPATGQPLQRAPGESQSAFNLRLLRA